MRSSSGTYQSITTAGEHAKAFVPNLLASGPILTIDRKLEDLARECEVALGKLEVATEQVPDRHFFSYGFVRREAILSSQIENVQATLTDLFSYESEAVSLTNVDDIQEVCNYIVAIQYAQKQLRSQAGLPFSKRLILEIHKKLLKGARGHGKRPGVFRASQNWIGGATARSAIYVPPPPEIVPDLMDDLERFTHAPPVGVHPLIAIGLIHVQFESIHPFLDGNGRVGRLLVALLLEKYGFVDALSFYPSLEFKRKRAQYYEALTRVREFGDWYGWSEFFLESLLISVNEAIALARNLIETHGIWRRKLHEREDVTVTALRLFEKLPAHPVLTLAKAVEILGVTKPTANKALAQLETAGVLRKLSSAQRNRVFTYRDYLRLLTKDTG